MRKKHISWLIVILMTTFMLSVMLTGRAYSGQVTHKEMVYGKEYRIETVDNEPGSYMVYWGDEKIKWEPMPWMPKELKEKGPAFYSYFRKRASDAGYWPYTITDQEQQKLDGKKIHEYFYINSSIPAAYNDFCNDYYSEMTTPRGNRYEVGGSEWLKRYRKQSDCGEGAVDWKYLYVQNYPEDSSGVGFLQVVYCGKKIEDNYLYLPSVRKVRRLAAGSRQDFLSRSINRQEDNALCKPIHNYTIKGTKLIGMQPKDWPGFDPADTRNAPTEWKGSDNTACRGIGEPAMVIEITPSQKDWWMAKEVKIVGIKTGIYYYGDAYDAQGRLIRRLPWWQGIWYHPRDEGKKDPFPYLHWAGFVGQDYLSGYHMKLLSFNVSIDSGIPDDIFKERVLTQEPKKLKFW